MNSEKVNEQILQLSSVSFSRHIKHDTGSSVALSALYTWITRLC